MNDMHLLVVDWDYFFPNPNESGDGAHGDWNLYDWGHKESPFYIHYVWGTRASAFLMAGQDLPMAHGYHGFWDRFQLSPGTKLMVGDSNVHAGTMFPDPHGRPWRGWDPVWLFDAHHDCGYRIRTLAQWRAAAEFTCEDWMLPHADRLSELYVRYPAWKHQAMDKEPVPFVPVERAVDDGEPVTDVVFDAVYLCRSGAWVPPWCDDQFVEFVSQFPGGWTQIDAEPLVRPFDRAEAQAVATNEQLLLNQLSATLPAETDHG